MRKFGFFFFLLLLLNICFGWWQEAHIIIGEIAKLQLEIDNPLTLQKASQAILSWQNNFPIASDFITAAYWADDLKFYLNAFDAWHAINRPYNPTNITVPPQSPENIVWAINQILSTLKKQPNDPSIAWAKTFMLRLLLHFVGDLHQPLHGATLFDEIFPEGDRAGNFFPIYMGEAKTNLHAAWDSALGQYEIFYERPLTPSELESIQNKAKEIMELYPVSSFNLSSIQNEDIQSWSMESYYLAIQYAYLNGTLLPNSTLDTNYYTNGRPICLMRMALAGYRLAYLIGQYPFDIPEFPIQCNSETSLTKGGIAGLAIGTSLLTFVLGAFLSFCIITKRKRNQYSQLK